MPAATVTMPEALQAKALYEQGYSLEQIGAQLNRSSKQLRTAFRHLGVPVRSRTEALRCRWIHEPKRWTARSVEANE